MFECEKFKMKDKVDIIEGHKDRGYTAEGIIF